MNKYIHGSVFKITPEDTPADIEKNFITMKENGLNSAVIWPSAFWWENREDGYPFNTGREILRLAEKHGISIIMELAGQISSMEYMPDFLMKKEYYATNADGSIRLGKPYGFLNYFHPEVNELICRHFRSTAEAYKNFGSLAGYDVFNETMFRSFDEYTIGEFRKWLREKYTTIDALNSSWGRSYSEWEQVEYTSWIWLSIMPQADYAAFRKAAVTRFLKNWCDAIRSVDQKHMLIADNILSMVDHTISYERPQDDFALREIVDEIGISFYPKLMGGCIEPARRWENFDAFFAASERSGYFVSEMQTHIQALFNPATAVRAHELKLWCYEALAGGAKGLIYWMWRPFTKGNQTLGRGLIDYKGRSTPRLKTVAALSALFEKTGALTPVRSKIAIVYNALCEDFQRVYTDVYNDVSDCIYKEAILGAYKAFFDNNIRCDITTLGDIDAYKAIILTNHLVMSESLYERLKAYVENGGIIICDGKFGITDELSMLCADLPGGKFNGYTGVDYIDSDYEDMNFTYNGLHVNGFYSKELVEITDGKVEAAFDDGYPAVVSRKCGTGEVLTINTQLWYGYKCNSDLSVKEFAAALADKFDLRQFKSETNLKIRICKNSGGYVIFAFNYTDKSEKADIFGEQIEVMPNDVGIVFKSEIF